MQLNKTESIISRDERLKVNQNWDTIESNINSLITDVHKNNETIESTHDIATEAKTTANATAQQLDDILREQGMSDAEVVAMRTNRVNGENFATAGERIDAEFENTQKISSVAHIKSVESTNLDIQQAIDIAVASKVIIPPGEYYIDASIPLVIPSNKKVEFAPGAVLHVIPNNLSSYAVIKLDGVENVEITGLQVRGDKDTHTGTAGEWGNGIEIRNSEHITIDGADISNCWGDGIYIGASRVGEIESENITIKNTVCRGNRRLGMALTAVKNVKVMDSHFCDTIGTDPQDGVDIEPNTGFTCEDIVFERCEFYNNVGNGLRTSEISGGTIRNVSAINCVFYNNKRNVMFSKSANPKVTGCTITRAREEGIYIQIDSTDAWVKDNKIYDNGLNGVVIRARSHRAIVQNNEIRANGANGARITSESCVVELNIITDNIQRGVSSEDAPRCEINGNRIFNNGDNGITVSGTSYNTSVQRNYILGNAKITSGYNVLITADNCTFKANTVRKGENASMPLRGLRLSMLNVCLVVDNDLVGSGENERIEVTTTALNVLDINNYPMRTSGTTAQRPTSPTVGFCYFDTNLQKPIWWKGASWADATNATV